MTIPQPPPPRFGRRCANCASQRDQQSSRAPNIPVPYLEEDFIEDSCEVASDLSQLGVPTPPLISRLHGICDFGETIRHAMFIAQHIENKDDFESVSESAPLICGKRIPFASRRTRHFILILITVTDSGGLEVYCHGTR